MEHLLSPMYAVGAVLVLAILIVLFRRFVPVKREISDDFFGTEPRATLPTQPDPEEVEVSSTIPLDPSTSATIGHPNLKPTMLDAALAKVEPEKPKPAPESKAVCCVCGDQADPTIVTMEQWEHAHGYVLRLLKLFGVVEDTEGVDKRRRLYEQQGWCRSCASIAQPLDRHHRDFQQAKRLAEDRQWEREGLRDSVKEVVLAERDRYQREKTRRRARELG